MTAAATAIPAIAPVDKERVLEFGEMVCILSPAVGEEVEVAPVAMAEVPDDAVFEALGGSLVELPEPKDATAVGITASDAEAVATPPTVENATSLTLPTELKLHNCPE